MIVSIIITLPGCNLHKYNKFRLMDCTMIPIERAFAFIIGSNLQKYYRLRLYNDIYRKGIYIHYLAQEGCRD